MRGRDGFGQFHCPGGIHFTLAWQAKVYGPSRQPFHQQAPAIRPAALVLEFVLKNRAFCPVLLNFIARNYSIEKMLKNGHFFHIPWGKVTQCRQGKSFIEKSTAPRKNVQIIIGFFGSQGDIFVTRLTF
jgi:hypothetical protein